MISGCAALIACITALSQALTALRFFTVMLETYPSSSSVMSRCTSPGFIPLQGSMMWRLICVAMTSAQTPFSMSAV
jgi:hypothetical protein